MWYLTSESDPRVIYVISQKSITVGRSVDGQICNFAIPDDASISRKHVTLEIVNNNLFLQDLGSRYGSFINDSSEKVQSDIPIQLHEGDIVKFGKLNSVWKVHHNNFITCTSTLKGENLQNLKSCLSKIGGILKSEWDDTCTYLTMPAITLTIKVVLALVQGSLIVTTQFWTKCLEAIENNMVLPDPKNFTPQIIESTLNKEIVSFLPNKNRKSLFIGKKILFFSRKQFEMYKAVLIQSSGTPLLLNEAKMSKSDLCEQNIIVIQYNVCNPDTQVSKNEINEIVNDLKNNGKRVIADAEIGLAILYCSIEKYCNPSFNFSSEVVKQTADNQRSTNVLAEDTQENKQAAEAKKESVVINESLQSESLPMNVSLNINSKRKLDSDNREIQENANKKIAVDVKSCDSRTNKRKNSDELNTADLNPNKKMATLDADNDSNDIFNFINSANNTNNNQTEKRLNLTKPLKRKQDMITENDDEALFKFVPEKTKRSAEDSSKTSIFHMKNYNNVNDETDDCPVVEKKKIAKDIEIDISTLRGSKLEELMKSNLEITTNSNAINVHKIKKEADDNESNDLDDKMNNLDLGTTIVTVKNDLIVKKEPLLVENGSISLKNFKKFKKVWPVKMQVTIISNSSANPSFTSNLVEKCSQSYDDIQE